MMPYMSMLHFIKFLTKMINLPLLPTIPLELPLIKQVRHWRTKKLVSQMTLDEKLDQLGGDSVFTTPGLKRLGVPPFRMSDGPYGVRSINGKSTCFPSPLALAATWDEILAYKMGKAIANDFKAFGFNVSLAPCINLIRDTRWGRAFETLGEDPCLAARLGTALIKGIQSKKVVAVLKHFACNNHETNRYQNNVVIDDCILHDLYLRHFYDCIRLANPRGLMSAYNKINGDYCSQNHSLLQNILKSSWNFQGFVVSDWNACHSGVNSILAGLDLEMPTAKFLNRTLKSAVIADELDAALIDRSVERIIEAKLWAGQQDCQPQNRRSNPTANKHICLDIALRSCVLLKNEKDILPINAVPLTIGVIGPLADYSSIVGGGSSEVDPHYTVTILDGIKSVAGNNQSIHFAKGCYMNPSECLVDDSLYTLNCFQGESGWKAKFYANDLFEAKPVVERNDKRLSYAWNTEQTEFGNIFKGFSARWETTLTFSKSGKFALGAISNGRLRILIDNSIIYDSLDMIEVARPRHVEFDFCDGKQYNIEIEYTYSYCFFSEITFFIANFDSDRLIKDAIAIAKKTDINIVCLGTDKYIETESRDRDSLALPQQQVALLQEICKVSSKNIVVLTSGSIVLMNWHSEVQGIMNTWFNGQEHGNAVAQLIFGKCAPSGRLPVSIPAVEKDLDISAIDYNKYSGTIGYRYYEYTGKVPLYEFGYGLSYTTFAYSDLKISRRRFPKRGVVVTLKITNIGRVEGTEVAQLYLRKADNSNHSYKDLRAFKKVSIKAGKSTWIQFVLNNLDMAYYDSTSRKYSKLHDKYLIAIGSSSRDIRLHEYIHLNSK